MDKKMRLTLVILPNRFYNVDKCHYPAVVVIFQHLPLIVAMLVLAMHIHHECKFIVTKQVMISTSEHA